MANHTEQNRETYWQVPQDGMGYHIGRYLLIVPIGADQEDVPS
jgi:hypothetical protein